MPKTPKNNKTTRRSRAQRKKNTTADRGAAPTPRAKRFFSTLALKNTKTKADLRRRGGRGSPPIWENKNCGSE